MHELRGKNANNTEVADGDIEDISELSYIQKKSLLYIWVVPAISALDKEARMILLYTDNSHDAKMGHFVGPLLSIINHS